MSSAVQSCKHHIWAIYFLQDTAVESKKLEDEEFQLENGKKYPIFTRIDRNKINCNICDLLMPKNTKDAFKHAASLGHQQRLCNVKLATKTLLSNLYCVLPQQSFHFYFLSKSV